VYTLAMTLKTAALSGFIGMALLTVVCALGFIGDISALLAGAIAPMMALKSLIHLLAVRGDQKRSHFRRIKAEPTEPPVLGA